MNKHLFSLLAVPLLVLPALAHNVSTKGYNELRAKSTRFFHAFSSKTAKIGAPMPNFAAPTLDGKGLSKASFKGKMALFVLADTICPCVDAIEERVQKLGTRYQSKGLRVVYVFATPGQKPIDISRFMRRHQIAYPAIVDKDQRILKMLDARCSSEVYLFDKKSVLRYHGRVDDCTFDPKNARQHNLAEAIAALVSNKPVRRSLVPAMGCVIPRL